MPLQAITPEDLRPFIEQIRELQKVVAILQQKQKGIPQYLRHKDVKNHIINVSLQTLNRWADEGYILRIKRAGVTMYDRDSLLSFLETEKLRKAV